MLQLKPPRSRTPTVSVESAEHIAEWVRMSRANLARLATLEKTGNHITNWRYMTNEQLVEAACGYNPRVVTSSHRQSSVPAGALAAPTAPSLPEEQAIDPP